MEFSAEVLRDLSTDPYFKIKFTYEDRHVNIPKGFAEITRTAPRPVIVFDSVSEKQLASIDKSKLELELMNTVAAYMFSKGLRRNWKGFLVLNNA